MNVSAMIKQINEVTENYNEGIMNIHYILQRSPTSFKSLVSSKEDPDIIFEVNINKSSESFIRIPDWDFNIQDYLFYDLEDGYEIVYMPLDTHYGIWLSVDQLRDEIYMKQGLQSYLSYCQINEITPSAIKALEKERIDITDLYKETNQGYTIIKSMNIDQDPIVLAKRNRNPSPFVTWHTSTNRKYGYSNGHYFSSYDDAFKDYEERCKDLLDKRLKHHALNFNHENEIKEVKNEQTI